MQGMVMDRPGVAPGIRRDIQDELDTIAGHADDLPGIWAGWSRLIEVSRRALDHYGEEGLALLRRHPVASLSRHCPLTNWSWQKPRGYPDDARLADFFYGHESVEASAAAATPCGQDLLAFARQSGLAEAVRERRAILARLVDRVAEEDEGEVLSLGAQHLREAELCRNAGDLARWVALDRDVESVEEIAEHYADLPGLVPAPVSLERTMLRPLEFGQFDLVYAATACEYLADREARRLVSAMFQALKPGGRLLVASFVPDLPENGYMAAFMDWHPIRRDAAGLGAVLDVVSPEACSHRTVFQGANRRIVYGMLERR
ncbi:class I SAM-dependent methyltransferase [Roseomonas sp. BN140053]|uniref:class I SAM-dependent methyltransferase n=1 Tax=Roseomonas sp. BN140053 TaxID=3391898 RepID=UPI0039EB8C9F